MTFIHSHGNLHDFLIFTHSTYVEGVESGEIDWPPRGGQMIDVKTNRLEPGKRLKHFPLFQS